MVDDIVGKTFNNLYVKSVTNKYNSYGRRLYLCKCLICGKERLATKANLKRGEVKDCGNHHKYHDITGKIYGNLKVIRVAENQEGHTGTDKSKIWECKCLICGNTCYYSYYQLNSGKYNSCGCKKKNAAKSLTQYRTNPALINSRKIPSTNTSGVMGVSFDKARGKWAANIAFQGTLYRLGRFDRKEDAITARKKAEENLFDNFLDWYREEHPEQWKRIKENERKKQKQ